MAESSRAESVALPTDAEERLVLAARGGDRRAFGQLFERYAPMVHGILLARVARPEVDDLVQEVFVSAMERMGGLRDAGAFGGWLAQITRNHAVDFHRTKKATTELPESLPAPAAPASEAEHVLEVIRSLPEAYTETLVLRLVEGMTGPEIAVRVGLTAESVRVNLHRGMKLLKGRLAEESPPSSAARAPRLARDTRRSDVK